MSAADEFLTPFPGIWNDFSGCLDCFFCSCCFAGRQINAIADEPDSVYWPTCCLAAFLVTMPCISLYIRRKVVAKYQLNEGSCVTNCGSFCLFPISMCQTMRELDLRDANPGGTCCVSTASIC
ncbi:Hypothetical protein, putative [Bodo saltans]|uniref:Transmembrane protein n=1 Tax=Bodo saltans TaxID=75058 RepID=A0A0S4IIW6_BODSA|nr:Hypothetical protein, putative [Bodo saltans]|eukprot:CUE73368.1 Hypothetical protein, putative [Bodo saltans]